MRARSGVSKSGSPAASVMTSFPAARMAFAFSLIARDAEAGMELMDRLNKYLILVSSFRMSPSVSGGLFPSSVFPYIFHYTCFRPLFKF